MNLRDLVDQFVGLINLAIPVLVGAALLLFFVSIIRYIHKSGDSHGKGEEKKAIILGLVALLVLFSIWGILRIASETFFGTPQRLDSGGSLRDQISPLNTGPEPWEVN
ncbi:MAG: hypothetical protein U1C66_03200 [Patescibacteria group bacterium]|nr:hypothetical protein [Patescibacteria group bacterium]